MQFRPRDEIDYPKHVQRPPHHKLRARGNLSYLQFIRLVEHFWSQAHPDVPIIPTGGNRDAVYPAILYGLELRQPHVNDPKMRIREQLNADDGDAYVINGQRFVNIVSFTVTCETSTGGNGAVLAEQVIEAFEDFMQEITPVIKEMGASEFVYSRRFSDHEVSRPAEGVVMRKVAYRLTTERIVSTEVERIEAMIVNAQVAQRGGWIEGYDEYSAFKDYAPKYYTYRGAPLIFYITEDNFVNNELTIPFSNFAIGDALLLSVSGDGENYPFPPIPAGKYYICNIEGNPLTADIRYEISAEPQSTECVEFESEATPPEPDEDGRIYFGIVNYLTAPDVKIGKIIDNFDSAVD